MSKVISTTKKPIPSERYTPMVRALAFKSGRIQGLIFSQGIFLNWFLKENMIQMEKIKWNEIKTIVREQLRIQGGGEAMFCRHRSMESRWWQKFGPQN